MDSQRTEVQMLRLIDIKNDEMIHLDSNALRNKIKQEAVVTDPVGAILISLYIIAFWMRQATRKY